MLPVQQPEGQLAALQTQVPPSQRWPAPHALPAPQRQTPPVQVLARVASQRMQRLPPEPHCVAVGVPTQVPPAQQPVGQVAAEQPAQVLPTQLWAPHDAQAAPPVPHTALELPGWQSPVASQQPLGQLVASQRHTPAEHRWPAWHGPVAPH